MTDTPDWLTVGADVVVIDWWGGIESLAVTKIKSVATRFFFVEGSPHRFRISDQTHYGDAWGPTRRVVLASSTEGQRYISDARRIKLERRALTVFDIWARNRTEDNRLAAIAALQDCAPEATE